jgi:hypothetical protein
MHIHNQSPANRQSNCCLISPSLDRKTALEAQLWENVQRAYAKSRCYRASDDPEYAKALAQYDRVANARQASNVIQFRPFRGCK